MKAVITARRRVVDVFFKAKHTHDQSSLFDGFRSLCNPGKQFLQAHTSKSVGNFIFKG